MVCSVGMLPLAGPVAAADAKALDLLQQGYAECKSAHLLRRKDPEGAKSAFEQYLNLKARAVALDAQLTQEPDAEAERIISYCNTVGEDIARTEALPLFTEGAAACAEASEYLRNNDLENARTAYNRYLSQTEEAVAVSPAILEVFSVSTEVRRCERVGEELAAAESNAEQAQQQLTETESYAQETLKRCKALPQPADMDEAALKALQKKLKQLVDRGEKLPNKELLQEEAALPVELLTAVVVLNKKVDSCQTAAKKAIDKREQQLIALAEEERQKELALQAQKEAEQRPETEEERAARLTKNYDYFTLVKRVAPEFPRRALRVGTEGFVIVEYKINPQGEVFDAVVVESQPSELFDRAAIKAVKQWKYEANFEEHEPDNALARTRMQFSLSD
mgnify:CR=1 FL=1